MESHCSKFMLPVWPALAVIWLLSACQTVPKDVSGAKPVSVDMPFVAEARMSIRHEERGVSGKLLWRHALETDVVQLYSPFGQQIASIQRVNQTYYLLQNKQVILTTDKADALLQDHLGYTVPVAQLPSWLLGIPVASQFKQNQSSAYATITADGWALQYDGFLKVDRYLLPTKITATKGQTQIRLIIDRWQIGSASS